MDTTSPLVEGTGYISSYGTCNDRIGSTSHSPSVMSEEGVKKDVLATIASDTDSNNVIPNEKPKVPWWSYIWVGTPFFTQVPNLH